MRRPLAYDRPHLKWSTYWNAWSAMYRGLERIGPTPREAFDTLKLAMSMGAKR